MAQDIRDVKTQGFNIEGIRGFRATCYVGRRRIQAGAETERKAYSAMIAKAYEKLNRG